MGKSTGLSINKVIYSLLANDSELKKKVGENIFPLVIDEDIRFPFVVFQREGCSKDETFKFGDRDIVDISVTSVSTNYDESLDIAEEVRRILSFDESEFVSAIEDYSDGAYIQNLIFKFKI